MLVYGGSAVGLMGIISKAVLERDGRVTGVEPRFFLQMGVEQHELTMLIEVDTMAERKAKMIELGDAFIALPGGVGTLEEISEIMSRLRLGFSGEPCLFLNIDGYYDPLKTMVDDMLAQEFIDQPTRNAIHFPESVEEATRLLTRAFAEK